MLAEILDITRLGVTVFAFSVFAVLAGAFLKGYTGFGASMLWVTSLSLVLPPLQVVPMVLMFEVATSIYLLPQIWKQVEWKSITVLLLGTWIATPAGIYALALVATRTDSCRPGAGGVRSGDSDFTRLCLEPDPRQACHRRRWPDGGTLEWQHGYRRSACNFVLLLLSDRRGSRPSIHYHLLYRHRLRRDCDVCCARSPTRRGPVAHSVVSTGTFVGRLVG